MLTVLAALSVSTAALPVAGTSCGGRSDGGWLCTIAGKASSPGSKGGATSPGPHTASAGPLCQPGGAESCVGWEPGPSRLSTAEALELAKDAIMLPPPRPHTNPARRTWVGLRTFLWIDRAQWHTQRARVTVTGQTITIMGRPTDVTWDLTETTLTCHGPGVPYRAGRTTYCGHSYSRSSAQMPGESYDISATVHYAVTWTCSGTCDSPGGTFGPLPATTHTRLAVGEIQTRTLP